MKSKSDPAKKWETYLQKLQYLENFVKPWNELQVVFEWAKGKVGYLYGEDNEQVSIPGYSFWTIV